jgi:glutathione S-transferase
MVSRLAHFASAAERAEPRIVSAGSLVLGLKGLPMPSETYDLYTISGAPRPWRALLALVAKGVPFTPRLLQGQQKEHKEPAFLAVNPRGRTPTLVAGDLVVSESIAILAYLERAHPTPPLFGTTAVETARIWEEVSVAEHDLRDAGNAVFGPVFKGEDTTTSAVQDGARLLLAELVRLDAKLARGPFVCGDRISAADCFVFPEVRLTLRAAERAPQVMRQLGLAPLAEIAPRLHAWVDRIEALPGYDRTYPPHWRA